MPSGKVTDLFSPLASKTSKALQFAETVQQLIPQRVEYEILGAVSACCDKPACPNCLGAGHAWKWESWHLSSWHLIVVYYILFGEFPMSRNYLEYADRLVKCYWWLDDLKSNG